MTNMERFGRDIPPFLHLWEVFLEREFISCEVKNTPHHQHSACWLIISSSCCQNIYVRVLSHQFFIRWVILHFPNGKIYGGLRFGITALASLWNAWSDLQQKITITLGVRSHTSNFKVQCQTCQYQIYVATKQQIELKGFKFKSSSLFILSNIPHLWCLVSSHM